MLNHFIENFKKLRKQKGLSQPMLADALKIKRSRVGSWEEGRAHPDFDMLITISNYFNISIDDLLKCQTIQEKIK